MLAVLPLFFAGLVVSVAHANLLTPIRPLVSSLAASNFVSLSWYAGWHADEGFPLSSVSWSKYTHVTYAFGITTANPSEISLASSDEKLLPQFVSLAHKNGVKASLSIGGWTGSLFFSTNVGSAANRTAFVKAVTNIASKYKLDGIDFDWEYPGRQGIGCNAISPSDSANFLSFLQQLRATTVGKKLVLSATASLTPFAGANGSPMTDVSAFAKVLDFVEVMNYDVWGSWSAAVGANAPLNDSCAAAAHQDGSAVSALKAWKAAKMPAHQIVLGVPSYGHSYSVTPTSAFGTANPTSKSALVAYPAFVAGKQPVGDAWDDTPGVDECGNLEGQGGIFDFWGMISGGFLNKDGSVAAGIASRFDSCSQTPFVYNRTSQVMISYDNAKSFAAKGRFIKTNGLRGFAMWEAGGDYKNILLDSILASAK